MTWWNMESAKAKIVTIDETDCADSESPDPNDSRLLRDQLKGQTTEHASPPRLEDEGQSGG
jgi:hypothetical protein